MHLIIDGNRRIVFERKLAVFPLENQTQKPLDRVDEHILDR